MLDVGSKQIKGLIRFDSIRRSLHWVTLVGGGSGSTLFFVVLVNRRLV